MQNHELKTDPDVFQAVIEKRKTCEVRRNDRNFAVGDTLLLRETAEPGAAMAAGAPLIYTGRQVHCVVSHMLLGPEYGIPDGIAVLSIVFAERAPKRVGHKCCVCGTKVGVHKDGWYGYRCSSDDCIPF